MVRVRVEFAGVNFIDVYHRTGQYKLPPGVGLGREGAGVREDTGERVAWAGVQGSYAKVIEAEPDVLVPVPDGVDTAHAAALMLQGMTAQYLVRATFPLAGAHVALVHAAAGGVGLLMAQLARRIGATSIGTTSTPEKAERALAAGYTRVVGYDDFAEHAKGACDVVYDSVGKTTFDRSLSCLRPRGMMVLFGQSSGAVGPIDPQILNRHGSIFLTRPKLDDYVRSRSELIERASEALTLTPTIAKVLPLAEYEQAHALLESRATSGKILLDCR